jgi:hypothetical protein
MQSVAGVFLIVGAELSMGAQNWGVGRHGLSHGGQSDAWSLCGRLPEVLPGYCCTAEMGQSGHVWAKLWWGVYGIRLTHRGGLGRGVRCGAAWMTALGPEGDIGSRPDQDVKGLESPKKRTIGLQCPQALLTTQCRRCRSTESLLGAHRQPAP